MKWKFLSNDFWGAHRQGFLGGINISINLPNSAAGYIMLIRKGNNSPHSTQVPHIIRIGLFSAFYILYAHTKFYS